MNYLWQVPTYWMSEKVLGLDINGNGTANGDCGMVFERGYDSS